MKPTEYLAIVNGPDAKRAEARVGGTLRGGYVVGDLFYTTIGSGCMAVPVDSVRDLQMHPKPDTRCSLGFGCDEAGVCYAAAHGQPEQCGRN